MLELLRRGDWQKALAKIDFGVVRRVAAWGSAAFIALVALVVTADSDSGSRRLKQAFSSDPAATAPVVAQIPQQQPEIEKLSQRLTETVKFLAADRARTNERIASLERSLEDVTGSIKKPDETAKDKTGASSQTVPMPMLVFSAMPMLPRGTPALWPEQQVARAHVPAPAPAVAAPQAVAVEPPAAVPLPPVAPLRTASVIDEPAEEPPPRGALGIDLGGARSIDALTIHWATMKAKFGPLLHGLQPVVSIRERKPGVPELRLIAGPMQSTDAVTQACMTIVAARAPCRPAIFAGQQLTQH